MQNRWKKAGCIRREPDSQSCHPRSDAWMRSPASICVSPAASRAALTCSGVGLLAALPARLRLGWLTIEHFLECRFFDNTKRAVVCAADGNKTFWRFRVVCENPIKTIITLKLYPSDVAGCVVFDGFEFESDVDHFISPAPVFPRRGVCDVLTIHTIHALRAMSRTFLNFFQGAKPAL